MSYDADFAHELRNAKSTGYKAADAHTVARQRARRVKDPRRLLSFYVATPEELRQIEAIEKSLQASKPKRR